MARVLPQGQTASGLEKLRAAPLPDDPNSFYCTRNTPLVNGLFGEITKERIVDETESSCDGYRRNCMACVNQAERILQTEQTNATLCVYAHVNRVHGELSWT
ncbi:hypothetical protein AHF37_10908 [Paragonimus kellicotti]|nr:hypothetical protein AHF37_10908 [Paragonimus kellicotti]